MTLAGVTAAIGLREASSQPIQRRLSIGLPAWPPDALPLRVALLSDIHLGNRAMSIDRLNSIVGQVNAARPDLILLAGDFIVGYHGQDICRAPATNMRSGRAALTCPTIEFEPINAHSPVAQVNVGQQRYP